MDKRGVARRILVPVLCLAAVAAAPIRRQQVNPTAAVLDRFQERVRDYLKVRKQVEATLPPLKTTADPAVIRDRQKALAQAIRQSRVTARPGDIFIPEVAPVFRKLIAADFTQRTPEQRRGALKEVPAVHLRPNDDYPDNLPLATVPPTLLAQLPRLPDGLEFRFVGSAIILRDINPNLVIDILDDVIPRR